jgi:hypothetical protein
MLEGILPHFELLFGPIELTSEASVVSSVRYRRLMVRQTLEAYGHWLDQDTVRRMLEELEGRTDP